MQPGARVVQELAAKYYPLARGRLFSQPASGPRAATPFVRCGGAHRDGRARSGSGGYRCLLGDGMEKERLRNGGRPDLQARKAEARADFRPLRCSTLVCRQSRPRTRRQHNPGVSCQSSSDQAAEGRGGVHPQEVGIAVGVSKLSSTRLFCYHNHCMAGEPPVIPDYELLRPIGRGAYGEVWLARSVTGIYRAVKIVYRASFEDARPFEREFAGIQRFEPLSRAQENQITILHVGRNEAAGYFFYVMELADDAETAEDIRPEKYVPKTLREMRLRHTRLSSKECLSIGMALTRALAHLHGNGLVHRDIKPSNLVFVHGVPN